MSSKQCWTQHINRLCMCAVLSRWGLTKKLICISCSDAAWSRPPPTSPRGSTQNHFVCRKNSYEIEDRKKKGEREREKEEYNRNELCQACALWRDTGVTGSMDAISNKCSIFFSFSWPSRWDFILKSWPKFLWITSPLLPPNNLISVLSG